MRSSCAVMVTVPVLAVWPAAMASSVSALSAKWAVVAGAAGVADTVTVILTSMASLSVAVTVAEPPFSSMDGLDSTSVAKGLTSCDAASVSVPSAPPV